MRKWITWILAITAIFSGMFASQWMLGQNKKEALRSQRDELSAKIKETKAMIADSEKKQKLTAGQIAILSEQIRYREKMIENINGELGQLDQNIQTEQSQVQLLEFQLQSLKDEYAKMVYQAYKNRSSYNSIVFILSAEDFYQAYKRYKIMQALSDGRRKQVDIIKDTESNLQNSIADLKISRTQIASIKNEQEKVKAEIDQDKLSQQEKLTSLKKEESKLRAQQKKHENDRKKLISKIQDIINKELAEERKKEEKERIKALAAIEKNKSDKVTTGSAPNSGISPKVAASSKSESKTTKIELAPEVVSLNANFENNKGNLPWPVSHGAITSHFGKHAHPSLEDITLNNNGVDFTTKQGETVLCVFGGKVTSVFSIPGAGYNIIVTHGTYKTVYSGLAQVNVKVGDKIAAKHNLGAVGAIDDEAVLHFELWAVSSTKGTAQNPESWIRRR
jgi:septal ring factor EnvC (AmiA/AmiB activator)